MSGSPKSMIAAPGGRCLARAIIAEKDECTCMYVDGKRKPWHIIQMTICRRSFRSSRSYSGPLLPESFSSIIFIFFYRDFCSSNFLFSSPPPPRLKYVEFNFPDMFPSVNYHKSLTKRLRIFHTNSHFFSKVGTSGKKTLRYNHGRICVV